MIYDGEEKLHRALYAVDAEASEEEYPALDADPAAHDERHEHHARHDAEAADLNQRQKHELRDDARLLGNVYDAEPGDAHRRSRYEERVDGRHRYVVDEIIGEP